MEEEYGRRMEKLDYRSVQTEVSGATQEYKVFTYQVEAILARAALSVSFVLVVAESRASSQRQHIRLAVTIIFSITHLLRVHRYP